MKNDQTRAWARRLRTTRRVQVTESLCELLTHRPRRSYGMCCLGVGEDLRGRDAYSMAYSGAAMPSVQFAQWLGLSVPFTSSPNWSIDILVDWDSSEYPAAKGDGLPFPSFAKLNDDWYLSFKQIADIIDFFGVKIGELEAS